MEKQCSGKRKRTAYISLPDFTERQLVQDYRLLEETQRAQVGRSAKQDRGSRSAEQRWGWAGNAVQCLFSEGELRLAS